MKVRYVLCLMLMSALIISCSKEKTDIIIGLNEPIQHDDFQYSATGFSIRKQIGENQSALVAAGNYYIVSFHVRNDAKRVNHPWDNTVAYIMDDAGKTYDNIPEAQKNLNMIDPFGWKQKYVTAYQSSDSTRFVFDLPKHPSKPCLMVRGQTLMGDFFDGGRFKRTKIRLY